MTGCCALTADSFQAQNAHSVPAKSIRISGRLVFPDGRPVSYSVGIARIDPDGFKEYRQTVSGGDGVFTFHAEPGHQYRITLDSSMKTERRTVDTSSNKDVDLGDMVFERCPPVTPQIRKNPASPVSTGNLKPEQIVIDVIDKPENLPVIAPRLTPNNGNGLFELPLCWPGPSLDRRSEWEAGGGASFDHWVTVEDFVGGKVKRIRVTRIAGNLTHDQVRNEVLKVWFGVFYHAASQIMWAEGGRWNVGASIEYESGPSGLLVTDGSHVQVQSPEFVL